MRVGNGERAFGDGRRWLQVAVQSVQLATVGLQSSAGHLRTVDQSDL